MRLALPLAFAGILSVVVECQQGNDASNFFDVLSSHPTLNSTYSALRWHSRGEFLQQLSALQNVSSDWSFKVLPVNLVMDFQHLDSMTKTPTISSSTCADMRSDNAAGDIPCADK